MDIFASTFQKKFCNILRNEGLKPFTSEEVFMKKYEKVWGNLENFF
jgi:hypothetical protein